MKREKQNSLQKISDDLNSLFSSDLPEIKNQEVFKITEEEKKKILSESNIDKKSESTNEKFFSFVKSKIRPDIGVNPFKEEDLQELKNENLSGIGKKIMENLRVGIKITFKF
jgi:hypothetical protein